MIVIFFVLGVSLCRKHPNYNNEYCHYKFPPPSLYVNINIIHNSQVLGLHELFKPLGRLLS